MRPRTAGPGGSARSPRRSHPPRSGPRHRRPGQGLGPWRWRPLAPGSEARCHSYGALALATNDLVRLGAVPVDELVHRLETELCRQGQFLDLGLEPCGADALDEIVELLVAVALG